MTTRRTVIEAALNAERAQVWCDLVVDLVAGKDPSDNRISSYVARIRNMGEAVGYPTDWRDIPIRGLSWYEMVETAPELGLAPFDDVPANPRDDDLPIDDHIRWFHSFSHEPEDPDDFDWETNG